MVHYVHIHVYRIHIAVFHGSEGVRSNGKHKDVFRRWQSSRDGGPRRTSSREREEDDINWASCRAAEAKIAATTQVMLQGMQAMFQEVLAKLEEREVKVEEAAERRAKS